MAERKIGQLSFADGMVAQAAGGNAVLEKVSEFIDWGPIDKLLAGVHGGTMGAPAYPALMMFKALLLQRWYALSDPALEEALKDRLSFRRFVGLALTASIPDHSSLWRFRGAMGTDPERASVCRDWPADRTLRLRAQAGNADRRLAGASSRERSQATRQGPATRRGWQAGQQAGEERARSRCRLDQEGRQVLLRLLGPCGTDKTSRIIRKIAFTPANINESQPADGLICGDEQIVYADKAYDSHARRRTLKDAGIANGIMRRGHPSKPLTRAERRRNNAISKHRGAIESLFSLFKNVYGFKRARYRGLVRNNTAILLAAIAINLKRVATA